MTIATENKALFVADLKKSLNLFLGAGFSVLAKNSLGTSLPLGEDLRKSMLDEFGLHEFSSLSLPQLSALVLSDRKEFFRKFLETKYRVEEFDDLYLELHKLNVSYIYTTNIDDLCSKIFVPDAQGFGRALHDRHLYGAPRSPEKIVDYVPLHGSIDHPDSELLFTSGQISSAFASDRETWFVFQRELSSRPTFFIGYSMNDSGVLQALNDSAGANPSNKWILLRNERPAERAYFESLGFHVAIGGVSDFLSEIKKIDFSTEIQSRKSQAIGAVPIVASVAKRPVKAFFIGAEPEWSDAYSTQITKRAINHKIINSIHGGRHCAVVGLPLSGKTTIIKQVAAELLGTFQCLYFDKITEPQSQVIVSDIGGEGNVVIFVDNMIDSMRQIEFILSKTSAIFVCAEQSVYFDGVRLKSFSGNLDVHSATEISAQDIQKILESIPTEVRRWRVVPNLVMEALEENIGDGGIFLALSRAVYDEALMERFKAKLHEFEERDREAFDVYIMACYVHRCRSLVSFDMLYMFLDRKRKDYSYASDVAARISHFLEEVELGENQHQDQDYFSVRSGGLADIALKLCKNRSFERVFERFHDAIPESVISDYPTFRRYAYNSDFVSRAFPNYKDGLKFYHRLVRRTQNAYDFQHGAIYLSKKKQFSQAFDWIDTALNKSGSRIFSIRNTHARILFEANIDVLSSEPENETARLGVTDSMSVLRGIIIDDSTRGYHLFTFCNQAIQYADICTDKSGAVWLTEASLKLREMISLAQRPGARESHNLYKLRRLLGEVECRIS